MPNEELVALIQKGENVSENMGLLYEQNKRIIYSLMKPYSSLVDMDDLMQEAFFALNDAVKGFDSSLGIKFMTYASWKVKCHAGRYAADNSRTKRIPAFMQERIRQYHKFKKEYRKEKGVEPNEDEIRKNLKISKKAFDELMLIIYESNCSSLEAVIENSDNLSISDMVADSTNIEESIVDSLTKQQLSRELWEQVETLDDKSSKVIYERYHEGKALQIVGDSLQLSGERVRQIEEAALEQLRKIKKIHQIAKDFDYDVSAAYHGSLGNFKSFGSSTIEYLVLKHIEQEEKEREATDLFNQILQMV